MAATAAKPGHGTQLFVAGTLCTDVRDLPGPSRSRTIVDVTPLDSDDNRHEKIAAEVDEGDFTVNLNYSASNAQHVALRDSFDNNTAIVFKRQFPQVAAAGDIPVETFTGWVSGWQGPNAAVGSELSVSVTIAITGKIAYTLV